MGEEHAIGLACRCSGRPGARFGIGGRKA